MPYTGPERQRTRAWWHDYRRSRAHFVTLTCHQQACLWGRIVDGQMWHAIFHDRIIRDEDVHAAIVRYVETHPLRWREDRFFAPDTFDPLMPEGGLPTPVRKS